MPEPHFDAYLSPNPGETVPKREKTSWTQDLRVKHIQDEIGYEDREIFKQYYLMKCHFV